MTVFQEDNYNRASWLVVVRVLLGILIVAKGYTLLSHNMAGQQLLSHTIYGMPGTVISILLVVSGLTHLLCGVLLIVGLLTRFAAGLQIPFVIYSVLFVNKGIDFSALNTNIWSFAITLILLIVFLVIGSGINSIDYRLHTKRFI